MTRRIELFAGIGAAIYGIAALALVIFGPLYSGESRTQTSGGTVTVERGRAALWELGIEPVALVFLAIFLITFISVGYGALMHARYDIRAGFHLVWASSLVLLVGTIAGLASIGFLLLPGTLLALIAAIAGTLRSGRREPDAA